MSDLGIPVDLVSHLFLMDPQTSQDIPGDSSWRSLKFLQNFGDLQGSQRWWSLEIPRDFPRDPRISPDRSLGIPRSVEIPGDHQRSPERNKRILKVALLYCSVYIYVYTYIHTYIHTYMYTLYIVKIYMEDLDHNSSSTILFYMHLTELNLYGGLGS